jgi:hypothetical protein
MNKILYSQINFPVLQNRVYETVEEANNCPTGNIEIVQNDKNGLIYNNAFDLNIIVYDKNYDNEQGASQHFQNHLLDVAEMVEQNLGKEKLVEVGCGKGLFLEMLLDRNVDIVGFDPTYVGKNPRVIKQFFEKGIISKPSNGLILRHVLEHIPNPYDFLSQLKEANGGKGLIYIEVPCFEWICKNRVWFDIFYEHVNYFRLDDFNRMFDKIISSGHFFGGQYLYIIADLSTLKDPALSVFQSNFDFPIDFLNNLKSNQKTKSDEKVCIWGGGSKGVIFSLLRHRESMPVDYVIDINSSKQGKYLPVTGLKVESPASVLSKLPKGSSIYVMNSNYLEEIKYMSKDEYNYITVDL